jgi:excisionase family DNA binding protein
VTDRPLDAAEVAALLNVPVSWVRESTRSGAMPHVKLGGRYVSFDLADVEAWLEECKQRARPVRIRLVELVRVRACPPTPAPSCNPRVVLQVSGAGARVLARRGPLAAGVGLALVALGRRADRRE